MRQILDITEATGSVFMVRGGAPTFSGPQDLLSAQIVIMDIHAGGTWNLEVRVPDGNWVPTGIELTSIDVHDFRSSGELEFRLTGGTVGARAYATGVWRAT